MEAGDKTSTRPSTEGVSSKSVITDRAFKTYILFVILILFLIATVLAIILTIVFFYQNNNNDITESDLADAGSTDDTTDRSNTATVIGKLDTGKVEKDTMHLYHLAKFRMTYFEAIKYCKNKDLKMITPETIRETQHIISQSYLQQNCNYYLLGYTLNENTRYKSIASNETWKSLMESTKASSPYIVKYCLELKAAPPLKVVRTVFCNEPLNVKCILMLKLDDANECFDQALSPKCIYRSDETKPFASVTEGVKTILKSVTGVYGLLPLDENAIPEVLNSYHPHSNADLCYSGAVKYVLQYQSIYNKDMLFRSNAYRVHDPESDCLGFDSQFPNSVFTASCKTPACVVCADI